jgi:ribosomal protein S18 acetylase RimI-like enzyme
MLCIIVKLRKMVTKDQIEIHLGLPERYRRQAAELFYEAFREKFQPLMTSSEHGVTILAKGLVPEMMIVALAGQQIVGAAGLYYHKKVFCNPGLSSFVEEFGWLSGFFRFVMFLLFIVGGDHDLTIDAIAVTASMRGKGVGTQLLEVVFDFARQNGFKSVSLEVVDTNPAARRLYERLGFVPTKTRKYPYLRNLMGFSTATMMVKEINEK